jgi:hypothetical protein
MKESLGIKEKTPPKGIEPLYPEGSWLANCALQVKHWLILIFFAFD